MADTTAADLIVTSKSGTVVADNLLLTLSTASGSSITPSTIKAMSGINQNLALGVAPVVTTAIAKLQVVADSSSSPANAAAANLIANLNSTNSTLAPTNAGFGSFINQAQGHVSDANDIKKATNFMANTPNFPDYGSGITNMSSLSCQGLNNEFGDLNKAGSIMSKAGSCYDTTDMSTFGQGTGFIDKINKVKMGTSTGLDSALTSNGVDITSLNDPVYTEQIQKTLQQQNDPLVLQSITDQLGVSPVGDINNMSDYLNINKLVGPEDLNGFDSSLSGIGTKFGDMGASFSNPAQADVMLGGLQIPNVPTLDASTPSLTELISSEQAQLDSMTGTGQGPLGMPSLTDFFQSISGGPDIDALNNSDIDMTSIANMETALNKQTTLFGQAGIDLSTPPPNNLNSSKTFATNLHKFGTDDISNQLLGNMASNNQYGDSIKSSLAEGKNNDLLGQYGVKKPDFNPFEGVPSSGDPVATQGSFGT
jgi:hypothetical protein|tara:strand:+ start:2463 stop:3902 length:1440 start_codon:yes stop_codon:yes gene_type:complete